ncbi:hypothetical protein ANO11243_071910 [Dothideomycetidae sp. 11243]|nr:hypothetical protein ANO11243_071910 [fungal sp. No.11243]
MRSAARTASLVAATLLALFLIFKHTLYSSAAIQTSFRRVQSTLLQQQDDSHYKDDIVIPSNISAVEAVWYRWSKIMYDHRPDVAKIELKQSAPSVGIPAKDASMRGLWQNLITNTETDLLIMQKAHAGFIKELNKVQEPGPWSGHGIVIVAGGRWFGTALTTIQMIRRLGSELPVEVFMKDEDEYEEYVCREFLPKLNAKCLVMTDFLKTGKHQWKASHFQLKVLALMFSSFQHVLFLDSDSMPITDPYKEMMLTEPYLSTGLILWPDFWRATESPAFYSVAGVPFPLDLPANSCESGQFMMDKNKHIKTLLLSVYYNIYGPDLYYKLLSQGAMGEGDKETFFFAAVVLNTTFYRVKHGVGALMNDDGSRSHGTGMLQYHAADEVSAGTDVSGGSRTTPPFVRSEDKDSRIAFLHAHSPKLNPGNMPYTDAIYSQEDKSKRLRIYGNKEKVIKMFGYDLEEAIWQIMVQTGCSLQDKIKDWKKKEDLCDKLHEHYDKLFGGN